MNNMSSDSRYWYNNKIINNIYDYKSIKGWLRYSNNNIPNYLEDLYEYMLDVFIDYLKTEHNYTRITKSVNGTILWLCKSIGRMVKYDLDGIKYSRSRTYYSLESVDQRNHVSRDMVIKLIDMLVKVEMGVNYTGYKVSDEINLISLLIPHEALINLVGDIPELAESNKPKITSFIELRDEEKKVIEPKRKDKKMVNELEDMMKEYNKALEGVTIEVNGYHIPEIFFRRVYNKDFNTGGRFYDASEVQGKSKEIRSTILIDGEPTAMMDFKALHPRMLYELSGIKIEDDFDPYTITLDVGVDGAGIDQHKERWGYLKYDPVRNLCKLCLLIMFNAESYSVAIRGINHAIYKDRKKGRESMKFFGLPKIVPVKEIVDSLVEHNEKIKNEFFNGVGMQLQNKDSDIINNCIQMFLVEDEVLLPMHDEVIAKESLKDFAVECMMKSYEQVLGSKMNCLIEEG